MDVRQIIYLEYASNCGVTQKPEAQIKGNVYSVNKKNIRDLLVLLTVKWGGIRCDNIFHNEKITFS